jgi:hypothetical protein
MFSVTYWAIIDLAFQSEATSPLLRRYSRNRERNMVELTLLLSRYFYGYVVAGIKRANPHLGRMTCHLSFFVSDSSRLDSDTVQ